MSEGTFSHTVKIAVMLLDFTALSIVFGPCQVKGAFEHIQNVRIHIILPMHKVSSGHLLFIGNFIKTKKKKKKKQNYKINYDLVCLLFCFINDHSPLFAFFHPPRTWHFKMFIVNLRRFTGMQNPLLFLTGSSLSMSNLTISANRNLF